MTEIGVLQQLGKHDKGGNRCVQILNWFDYRNHICISSSRSPTSYFKRVIDFGSTTYDRQDQNYIVSTRHYRAPEDLAGAILVIYEVWVVHWLSYARGCLDMKPSEKTCSQGSS
ncbi:hypothetical protein VNO78_23977 [Psophocarpus tetragonolobus]|uniref:Protein kinase domain-containing protein n=1 Tax=Psophocarpus tetragonolobus TaxID=3891 RepID=A0AAN9XEV9_PSOTE